MLGTDLSCGGRLWSTRFETVELVCTLQAIVILENDKSLLSLASANDGKQFAGSRYKDSCSYLVTEDKFSQELVPNEPYTAVLTTDVNPFLLAFENPAIQIFHRGVLGAGFASIVFLAPWTYMIRLRKGTSNFVFATVLGINFVSASVLAVVQICGAQFIAGTVHMEVVLFSFPLFFGNSVSTAFLIAILYRDVLRRTFGDRTNMDILRANCDFICIAAFLSVFDWVVSFLIGFGNINLDLLVLLRMAMGGIFLLGQIWIATYLTIMVCRMINRVKPKGHAAVKGTMTRAIEYHFRFWIKVSLLGAATSTISLVGIALDLMSVSPEMYLGVSILGAMGKILNLYSQTKVGQISSIKVATYVYVAMCSCNYHFKIQNRTSE